MPIRSLLRRMLQARGERSPSRSGPTPGTPGIRVASEDELLAAHADLLRRIRIAYGGDEGTYEARLAPVIRRYAALIHLLPATPDAHFREAGGLLRCGLEVAFHALQAADGQIFSARRTVPERRAMEPRWRTAFFIAGLCAELHRALSAVVVTEEGETDWSPLVLPLGTWLRERGCPHYEVRWRTPTEPLAAGGLLLLPQVVSPPLLAFLAEGDRAVLSQMMASLAGASPQGPGVLGEIVHRTLGLVVDRDLRRHASSPPHAVPSSAPPDAVVPAQPRRPDEQGEATGIPSPAASVTPSEDEQRGVASKIHPRRREGRPKSAPQAPPPAIRHRELLLPPTLNPLVAEALRSLLSGNAEAWEREGVETTDEGIYVALTAWQRHGLDTGIVVRALHESRLLVPDRGTEDPAPASERLGSTRGAPRPRNPRLTAPARCSSASTRCRGGPRWRPTRHSAGCLPLARSGCSPSVARTRPCYRRCSRRAAQSSPACASERRAACCARGPRSREGRPSR